ncbi:hypothetical protein ACFLTM_02690 [Candidatus Bipolaricaulota bacterium]
MSRHVVRAVVVALIAATVLGSIAFAIKIKLPDTEGSVWASKVIDFDIPSTGSCIWASENFRPMLGRQGDSIAIDGAAKDAGTEDGTPLGENGFVVVRMGSVFTCGEGTDLRVYSKPNEGYYNVSVSSDAENWTEVASRVRTDSSKLWYRSIDFGSLEGVFEYVRIDAVSGNDCAPWIFAIEATHPTEVAAPPVAAVATPPPAAAPPAAAPPAAAVAETEEFSLSDDFADITSGWETSSGKSEGFGYRDGEFSFRISEKEMTFWSWAPMEGARLADFHAEALGRKFSGAEDALYGITWGTDNDNLYYFAISADGWFVVWFKEGGGWQTDAVDWAQSDAILQGEDPNRLEVIVEDGVATLIVNDIELASFAMGLVGPYQVGVFGATYEIAPAEVRFTEFVLGVPSEGRSSRTP